MIKNLRLIAVLLFLTLLLNSCRNEIVSEVDATACVPVIANPRLDWYSLNDCTLSSGSQSSVFYVLIDKFGACLDENSPFTITVNFYNSAGLISDNEISFDQTSYMLRDQFRLGVCLRFGQEATVSAKMEIKGKGSNGKDSNTLSLILNRPKGAY